MDKNPLVSIIIPTFNRYSLLCETLDSVLNQTYTNLEAIVVDDHSTDETWDYLSNHPDPRIKPLRRQGSKGGGSVARNQGLTVASGEYILFLDSDDLISKNCLTQRVEALQKKPNLDFGVFPMLIFKETPFDLNILVNIDTGENSLDRFLKRDHPWLISQPLWKKSFLDKVGGFNEDLPSYQDYEFHIKTLSANPSFQFFDLPPDNYYRQHQGERIQHVNMTSDHIRSRKMMIELIINHLDRNNALNNQRKHYIARSIYQITQELIHGDIKRGKEVNEIWRISLEKKLIPFQLYQLIKLHLNLLTSPLGSIPGTARISNLLKKIFLQKWLEPFETTRLKIKYTPD